MNNGVENMQRALDDLRDTLYAQRWYLVRAYGFAMLVVLILAWLKVI